MDINGGFIERGGGGGYVVCGMLIGVHWPVNVVSGCNEAAGTLAPARRRRRPPPSIQHTNRTPINFW